SGFRMPAEWEPHEATWIGWPHNRIDWPGKFSAIAWVYGEIVRKIAAGEIGCIIAEPKTPEHSAPRVLSKVGVDLSSIEFFRFATDRGWTRDMGPLFVKNDATGEIAIVRFRFNAWAKYPDWHNDRKTPKRAAEALGVQLIRAVVPRIGKKTRRDDFVLEGGAIDVNGRGTLISTEECLLDQEIQPRNPGVEFHHVESRLMAYFGVKNLIWLAKGIEADDTHGHVDDVCRFTGPRTIVLCEEKNPNDYNYRILSENRERLEGAQLEDGSKPEVVRLPMPEPLFFEARRLPASYANFYVCNAAVLVPTFNDPADRVALGILSELITDRPVVGIHAVDLVWGLGTLHCLTQQQPGTGSEGATR